MTRDNEWKSYICTVKQWYVVTFFIRVIYIYANSPGLSGSVPLSRTGDQNSLIKGSLDQLPTKKTTIQSLFFPKFQNHLASYACITVSGFIFLRDARCSLQTKREENFLFEVPDRQIHVFPSKLIGGGRGNIFQIQNPALISIKRSPLPISMWLD